MLTFELLPAYKTAAEKKRSARHRRQFMRRRAILRWIIKTFRLYRYGNW